MADLQRVPTVKNLQTQIRKLNLRFPIKEISEKTGFNKGSISSYVNGKIPPSVPFVEKLAESFNLKIEDFFEDSFFDNDDTTGFYYPDIYASAGLDKELNSDDLKKIPVDIPGWEKGLDFINVYGDSMYPKYNAGEVIGVKLVEFQYVNYGYPYVVTFNNGDTYIKIVKKGTDDEHLKLESINTFYEPKEFHLSLIKSFYSIRGVIKKELM